MRCGRFVQRWWRINIKSSSRSCGSRNHGEKKMILKIIETAKYTRGCPNEVLVAENIKEHKFAVVMCMALNERFSDEREYKVEHESYVLKVAGDDAKRT
jgi:hypothetical protein